MPARRPRSPFTTGLAGLLALAAGCGAAPDPASPAEALAATEAILAKKGGGSGGGGGLPDRYVLPGATVFPEGIAVDQRTQTVYVSSTTDGTIFCGELSDATLAPCFPGDPTGRSTAAGLDVDRDGRLFVAGGATGKVFVLDASGATLATLQGATGDTFVNDVVVTRDGTAYATDSRNPVLYRVTRSAAGTYVLEPWLSLAGTVIEYRAGFNLNGIAATPDGGTLYVVQSNTGLLFRIDVATRTITRVDVGGEPLTAGDGLELHGRTLYVLRNQQETIVEIRLDGDGDSGTVVSRTTDDAFMFPTTFVEARGRFLVVNSQFDRRAPGQTPVLPFTVAVVKKP